MPRTTIFRLSVAAALAAAALGAGASGATAATVSISDAGSVPEGSNGAGGTASFTVTVQRLATDTVTVTPSVVGGSAAPGLDFVGTPPALTLSTTACTMGATPNTCTDTYSLGVPIVGDNLHEADETFRVALAATGATITPGGGNATILDDDAPPRLKVNGTRIVEGDAGTKAATIGFELDAPSGLPVDVHYATSDLTATAGSDYVARTGTVHFPPGSTEAEASILVLGDTLVEPDEQFHVFVTSLTGAMLDDGGANVTIVNDDVRPPPPPPPVVPAKPRPVQGSAPSAGGSGTPLTVYVQTPGTGAAGQGQSQQQPRRVRRARRAHHRHHRRHVHRAKRRQ
jgi:hypothetical protein